jgi:V/A-type H+-transporting ATPase subunit A
MAAGKIVKVSGPLVVADGMGDVKMYDIVRIGNQRLVGEVIEIRGDRAWIQVYEQTGGIGPGEPVEGTNEPLTVDLGPGLLSSIYDGIQRPLDRIRGEVGPYITRGVEVPGLDMDKTWKFEPRVKTGDEAVAGDVVGVVQETPLIEHRIMVPPGAKGKVASIESGEFKVKDVVCTLDGADGGPSTEIKMMQAWPVREGRPFREKLAPRMSLITGQRVIDFFFPVRKGGTACVPGPFGSGKTVIQHQLAKWTDAEIIVYVGCGERGNEMTDVLLEFPELKDPTSGRPLMERTVMIANTSNMPVAAREASVYTGVTIAEYFRDMGYSVALMADSTSRWAEAMREMSGRLEEMPGDEGYPAYMPRRIAEFYERSGLVECIGSDGRQGSLTIVGAVSPPGGDLSDPVVQSTLRVVKVFWSLEDTLAYRRHFPAINWLTSYSLYLEDREGGVAEELREKWHDQRTRAMALLQEETTLEEIARLIGVDALSPADRLTLQVTRAIREDFLHQNAFDEIDTYTSMAKQMAMMETILHARDVCARALEEGVEIADLIAMKSWESIARARMVPEGELERFAEIRSEIDDETAGLVSQVKTRG